MKKILILLLLLSCETDMKISDACEIQFWPTGQPSFNEEIAGYTQQTCFSQKFLCTGNRKLQVLGGSQESSLLTLSVLENGTEIANLPFVNTPGEAGNPTYFDLPPLSSAYSLPRGYIDWSLGTNPSFEATPGGGAVQSNYLVLDYDFVDGFTYNFVPKINYFGWGTIYFVVLNSLDAEVESHSRALLGEPPPGGYPIDHPYNIPVEFTAGADYKKIAFYVQLTDFESGGGSVTTNSITSLVTPVYDYFLNTITFNPYDQGWCDKTLEFKIFDDAEEIFHSDTIEFVSVWANNVSSGRVNIQYRNSKNFAGLIYSGTDYFSIDLDAQFRKEKQITTQKTTDSTDIILNTASTLKLQKLLRVSYVPDYMHRKINLILAHAASGSVLVNGTSITVEEGYDIDEVPSSYPLSQAEIYLTDKYYYKHNIL